VNLNFHKGNGLLPAIIQDELTGKVLMLGFMNEEAYLQTLNSKKVTFFSRSKNRLWVKGETSGNYLHLKKIIIDCDNDTLLIKANPEGPVCHTGADTCFYESNQQNVIFLDYLKELIRDRKNNAIESSYTGSLFKKGINKIAQKVGEEAVELVIEAMDNNEELFKEEAADLLFHFLVLLEEKNVDLNEVISILKRRHRS
jgi:phosphoribosyl-AMP cyclohydrolase / phosphoribosyl-ATP pyrophosphohydrolase